jgi:hypothetical protein
MKNKNLKRVSILGCGWVGKALAKKLEPFYSVMVSVQSQSSLDKLEIKNKIILNSSNGFSSSEFYETDVLIIAIPPRDAYLENLNTIFTYIKKDTQVILLSSTSVYTQTKGVVSEKDTEKITNPPLMLQAERLLQQKYPSLLILRLGGLMGYNRVAGKYTAGKTLEHDAYVNYVHRDDVVAIIEKCIEQNIKANCFNVVAPLRATKRKIYDYNSKCYGFEKTLFLSSEVKGKRVSSLKLMEEIGNLFLFDKMGIVFRNS